VPATGLTIVAALLSALLTYARGLTIAVAAAGSVVKIVVVPRPTGEALMTTTVSAKVNVCEPTCDPSAAMRIASIRRDVTDKGNETKD